MLHVHWLGKLGMTNKHHHQSRIDSRFAIRSKAFHEQTRTHIRTPSNAFVDHTFTYKHRVITGTRLNWRFSTIQLHVTWNRSTPRVCKRRTYNWTFNLKITTVRQNLFPLVSLSSPHLFGPSFREKKKRHAVRTSVLP